MLSTRPAVVILFAVALTVCSALAHPPHEHGLPFAAKEAIRLPIAIATFGIMAVYFENSDDELAWRLDQQAVARGEITPEQAEYRHAMRREGTTAKQTERGRIIGGVLAGAATS